ncbi:MAG: LapA family protein [Novosphingobium sp.]
MQIIRTIAWVVLTIVLVLFAVANWRPVEVTLWTDLILDTRLPVLVVGAFLLGLVPMWLVHRTAVWRLRRRLAQLGENPAAMPEPAIPEIAAPAP